MVEKSKKEKAMRDMKKRLKGAKDKIVAQLDKAKVKKPVVKKPVFMKTSSPLTNGLPTPRTLATAPLPKEKTQDEIT